MSDTKAGGEDDSNSGVKTFEYHGAEAGAIGHLVGLMAIQTKHYAQSIEEYCAALQIDDEMKGIAAVEAGAFWLMANAAMMLEMKGVAGVELTAPSALITLIANAVPKLADMTEVDVDHFAERLKIGIDRAVATKKLAAMEPEGDPH